MAKADNKLIRLPGILFVFVVVLLVLYLLFPDNIQFGDDKKSDEPADALSLAYLKVRLKSDKANVSLRIKLAKQLQQVGEFKESVKVLSPVVYRTELITIRNEQFYTDALVLWLNALLSLNLSTTESLDIDATIKALVNSDLSSVDKEKLLNTLERLNKPELKASAFTQLSVKKEFTAIQSQLLILAAKAYYSADNIVNGNSSFSSAYQKSSAQEKPEVAITHLNALLAANQPGEAFKFTQYYLKRHPNSMPLLKLCINIAQQNSELSSVIAYKEALLKNINQDNSNLKHDLELKLFSLYIAAGSLDKAETMANKWLREKRQLSASNKSKVAQLYEWQGEPRKAYKLWLTLLNTNSKAKVRAIELSNGLNDARLSVQLYQKLASSNTLTKQQLKAYYQALISSSPISTTEQRLKDYVNKYPSLTSRWLLRSFYYDNFQFNKAQQQDSLINQRYANLDANKLLSIVDLNWELNQPDIAITRLNKWINGHKKVPVTVWQKLADIAWYLGDSESAKLAYEKIYQQRGVFSKEHMRQAIDLAASDDDYLKIQQLALDGWKKYAEYDFLVIALDASINIEDYSTAEALIKKQSPEQLPENYRVQYQLIAAQIYRRNNNVSKATELTYAALQAAPDNAAVKEALLWLLIDGSNDKLPQLNRLLESYESQGFVRPALRSAMAAGWLKLKQYRNALYWMEQDRSANKENVRWLSDYAYTLHQAGYRTDAYQVRRRIIHILHSNTTEQNSDLQNNDLQNTELQNKAVPNTAVLNSAVLNTDLTQQEQIIKARTQSLLNGQLTGLAQIPEYILQQLYQINNSNDLFDATDKDNLTQWLILLLEWALQNNRKEQATYLYNLANALNIHLPEWLKLSYGLMTFDKTIIERSLKSNESLPLADQTFALYKMGYTGDSIAFGLTQLRDTLSNDETNQLRRITTSLRQDLPNGAKLTASQSAIGDIDLNGQSFNYVHAFDESLINLELNNQAIEVINTSLLLPVFDHENELNLVNTYLNGSNKTRWNINFRTLESPTLENSSSTSLRFGQNYQPTSRLQLDYQFQYKQRDSISSAFYLLGNKNAVKSSASYQVDRANRIYSELTFNQYKGLDNETLGNGNEFRLGIQHQLMYQDPAWTLYSEFYSLNNSLNILNSSRYTPYFKQQPSIDLLLPKQYCRTSIGSTWQKGDPGSIVQTAPSPHYLLNIDLGWLCHENSFDFALSTAIGWRIFGDDELSFGLRFSSSKVDSQDNQSIYLSYSKYFGR